MWTGFATQTEAGTVVVANSNWLIFFLTTKDHIGGWYINVHTSLDAFTGVKIHITERFWLLSMEVRSATMPSPNLELCLDFTDTVDWRTGEHPKDGLQTYADLVNWGQRKGILDARESRRLIRSASVQRATAEEVVEQARDLRDATYRIFSAAAHGRKTAIEDVKILNEYLGKAMAKMEVQVTDTGYKLGWCGEELADKMLYPIAKSAAELLTSEHLTRVRECANEEEGCGSMFLDYSKSHSRRWCSMESCGNKVKLRTYYARHARTSGLK
jgi:predicted RNA-binding Zn ribbon-like protein